MDSCRSHIKRPSYIPQEFYESVIQHISMLEKHAATRNMSSEGNKIFGAIDMDKIAYFSNLISNSPILKDFYLHNSDKPELLDKLLLLFDSASHWQHDFKTSGTEDAAIANKLRGKLLDCAVLLCDSPDLRFNIQMQWESHVREIINDAYRHELTAKGIELKHTKPDKRPLNPKYWREIPEIPGDRKWGNKPYPRYPEIELQPVKETSN